MPDDSLPRRLDSWKEIADYLRKNQRTAMRWEQDLGLPVRRLAGRSRAGVFAYADELDTWLKQQKEADNATADETLTLEGPARAASSDAQSENRGSDSAVSGSIKGGRSNVGQARQQRALHWVLGMGGVLAAVVALSLIALLRPEPTLRLVSRRQITSDARQKLSVRSDGVRLYLTEMVAGKQQIMVVPTSGGETMPLTTGIPDPLLEDVSPDGATLLLRSRAPGIDWSETPLYTMSAAGGEARRVGNGATNTAIWQADGQGILFVRGKQVWQATLAPYAERLLLSLPAAPHDLVLSPDSRQLLIRAFDFASRQYSLWVGNSDGTGFRRILKGSNLLVEWAPGGDRLLYLDNPEDGDGVSNVASLEVSSTPFLRERVRSVDARGAGRVLGIYRRSRELFVLRSADSAEILRYDPPTRTFKRTMDGLPAVDVTYSPDHQRLAYIHWPDYTLWTARPDGSARKQLTFPPLRAMLPRFSPDGSKLAVTASTVGSPWRIWIMPASGGAMERLTRSESSEHSEGAPTWLPDGKSIVFANIVCESPADSICRVHRVDLETRRTIDIPGSDGLRTARVSPDGRFLAAQRESTGQILLYSFGTGRWSELATRVSGDDLAWTRDSGSIFGYTRWAEEPVLLRISVRDHRVTRVTSLSGLIDSAGSSRYWMGLDDQDRPLLFHSFSAVEVYSAEINQ